MSSYEKEGPVQKLVAKNYEEAKRRLNELYGRDFTITNKRQILSGGFLGFGQQEKLEVSYTVKDRSARPDLSAPPEPDSAAFSRLQEDVLRAAEKRLRDSQADSIGSKLDELKSELKKEIQSVSGGEKHPSIRKIEELLVQNEFTFSYISSVTDRIKKTFPLEQLDDFDSVQRAVVDWIGESVTIAPERVFRKPHVVIIVGPTGVGKTTTLMKLAAQFVLKAKKEDRAADLCLITTDTMRVGAMEQISRYGDIFVTNVLKAESAADVKKIYEERKDSVDEFFIDTSGYSPNDARHIGEMKMTLDVQGLDPDIYLAVAASTKARDLQNIMQNYEPFGYKSVIVTKCDESDQYGNVISVLSEKHKSVSYITNGQNAARNIERASVVQFLTRLENFKIDRVHIEDKFGED